MIYTETGKYAIRALLYLADSDGDRTVTASEIATAEGIPPYYLAKVLKDLSNAGILSSVRGRGGGFQLSRPAKQITVLEVLEAAEGLSRRVKACVLGLDECTDEAPCAMHDYWSNFRDTTLRTLGALTMEDLRDELHQKRESASVA
jgi:Rrf2 family protein